MGVHFSETSDWLSLDLSPRIEIAPRITIAAAVVVETTTAITLAARQLQATAVRAVDTRIEPLLEGAFHVVFANGSAPSVKVMSQTSSRTAHHSGCLTYIDRGVKGGEVLREEG